MLTRLFIFIFCTNLFTGGVLFGELAKMPALVQHFQVHKIEKNDLTFTYFLWQHYFDSKHTSTATHDHHSLPFHHDSCHNSHTLMAWSLPAQEHPFYNISADSSEALASANFYYGHYLPVGFVGSLFQPPRA